MVEHILQTCPCLAKARKGGADYIYSLLLGYEEAPTGFELDDGVYYNKYMPGNKIKMISHHFLMDLLNILTGLRQQQHKWQKM